ncbi:MAG TPA: septum formation initiator family protein [Ignavibacteriaceae bacterium]|nr:septum formation initiator family protein [Ignavibacteriaceae bacterium]
MSISKRKKSFLYAFLFLITVGIFYWIFNDYGLVKYVSIRNEVDSLKQQLSVVEMENERLKNEIDSLKKKIPAKIERVAREKYGMKRQNELRIEIDEKESDKNQ